MEHAQAHAHGACTCLAAVGTVAAYLGLTLAGSGRAMDALTNYLESLDYLDIISLVNTFFYSLAKTYLSLLVCALLALDHHVLCCPLLSFCSLLAA